MQIRARLACLALTLCAPGCDDGSGPVAEETGALAGVTAAHNAARASVSPAPASPLPPLVWAPELAQTAQAWADRCKFGHSSSPYGENIFAGSGAYGAQAVVTSWVSEQKSYSLASNSCSGVCGHYTQVVWAGSLRLGCGVANCTQNSPFGGGTWQLWVCNYDPPGNVNGARPY